MWFNFQMQQAEGFMATADVQGQTLLNKIHNNFLHIMYQFSSKYIFFTSFMHYLKNFHNGKHLSTLISYKACS